MLKKGKEEKNMPAFYTHYHFAKEVFQKLSPNLKKNINYEYYLLFAQSFDFLYYNYGKNKYLSTLAHQAHAKNTQAFFINAIEEINNFKQEKPFILGFIYGTLTHYILDSTFHPYIFYKTGVYKKGKKETYIYNGEHRRLEAQLDKYYYSKKHNDKFNKARLYKIYESIPKPSLEFINYLNNVFYKTFYKKDIGTYYFKSIKKWRFMQKHFIRDSLGIKKVIYKFIDLFPNHLKLQYFSNKINDISLNDLNIENKEWCNPADKEIISNLSVDELYDLAISKYLNIIKTLSLDSYRAISFPIENISYLSGLDLKNNKKLKYFEKL